MSALIWKDVRACRTVLIVAALAFLGPYIINLLLLAGSLSSLGISAQDAAARLLETSAYFAIFCSPLTLAAVSANLIAIERADRSAEFLAYLPPPRSEILGAKACVLVASATIVWGLNFAVLGLAGQLRDVAPSYIAELPSWSHAVAIGVAAIGAGWLGSAHFDGPSTAFLAAFVGPMLVLAALAMTVYFLRWPAGGDFGTWFDLGCLVLGQICFILGWYVYVRRIEP